MVFFSSRSEPTEINRISLVARPELLAVELHEGPVLGEVGAGLADAKGDRRGGDNMAENAVVVVAPLLFDPAQELGELFRVRMRLFHQLRGLDPSFTSPPGVVGVVTGLPRLEPLDLPPPVFHADAVRPDPALDAVDELLVCPVAEEVHVATGPTLVVRIVVVGFLVAKDDVAAGESQEPPASVVKLEAHGALRLRRGGRVDAEAQGGRERADDVEEVVEVADGREEARAGYVVMHLGVTGRLGDGAVDSTADGISREKGYM